MPGTIFTLFEHIVENVLMFCVLEHFAVDTGEAKQKTYLHAVGRALQLQCDCGVKIPRRAALLLQPGAGSFSLAQFPHLYNGMK